CARACPFLFSSRRWHTRSKRDWSSDVCSSDLIVSYTQLTHVQLNHGESDKGPSFSPVFRSYDKDFVAGQAAIDRFAANGVAMPASGRASGRGRGASRGGGRVVQKTAGTGRGGN